MNSKKLGEIFVKAGLISHDTLARALAENQKHPDEKLAQTLVRLKLVSDVEVARTLSLYFNTPYLDLNTVVIDPHAVKQIPFELAVKHHILPIYIERNNLILAMEDPQDFEALEAARFTSGLNIRHHVAASQEIAAGIKRYYAVEESADEAVQATDLDEDEQFILSHIKPSDDQLHNLKMQSESPAITKMLNTMIFQGMAVRASAIQIEPQKQNAVIKNRIDGVLTESMKISKGDQMALVARLKIMAGMDFTQRHIPQKGRTKFMMQQRAIEMEISSLPALHGESLTIKILDTGETIPRIKDLEFLPDDLTRLHKLLWLPQGMILVCGPPASGKTTTLYAMAHELSRHQRKITTIEESIEYRLKDTHQVQINEQAGLTFSQALDSVLKHHPNVILLGEIRDRETAEMAMKAAQTGHMVQSIVRANDIMSTLLRIHNLGVDPKLFATSLSGLITQRLIRTICPECRERCTPPRTLAKKIEEQLGEKLSGPFHHGKGCHACNFTGYQERFGIYYVVNMSPALQRVILEGSSKRGENTAISRIEKAILMKNILGKVKQGLTTLEELERTLFPRDATKHVSTVKRPVQELETPDTKAAAPAPQVKETPLSAPPQSTEASLAAAQITPAAPKENIRSAATRYKILLIDIDPDIVKHLKKVLENRQFAVTAVSTLKEALARIVREKPHLVIMEMVLPTFNGLELIRHLRKNHATASLPIIIVSIRGETADRIKGFAAGADDYIPKPFSVQELFYRINAILRRAYS